MFAVFFQPPKNGMFAGPNLLSTPGKVFFRIEGKVFFEHPTDIFQH